MSKRSGMSRLEDLKRGFVDVGRYRYILHKFDMESYRDKTCPICGENFIKEPNYIVMNYSFHTSVNPNSRGEDCGFGPAFDKWYQELCDRLDAEGYND